MNIGYKVTIGNNREMEVYEETSSTGEKYLALRHWNETTKSYDEYNGKLTDYLEGLWGGI
jgi:hypothetical protein